MDNYNNSTLELDATVVYYKNAIAKTRFVVNEGGTRSSKTYSLAQRFLMLMLQNDNLLLTVARKTLSALKTTAMRDFFDLLKHHNLYYDDLHNKTDRTYQIGSNVIEFMGMDSPQKRRGAKRHYLWLNEANELTYEDFKQLNLRTEKQVFMDYNPSFSEHWIDEKILTRRDVTIIKSTYRDNPFLPDELIYEIEMLAEQDKTAFQIFGLGERAVAENLIFTNWTKQAFPAETDISFFGIDFGYNNPSAVVEVGLKDQLIYVRQVLYKTKCSNDEIIEELKNAKVGKSLVFADSAEPDRITEIKRAGINIYAAKKGPNSVKSDIDIVRRFKLHIDPNALDLIKEIKSYKWIVDSNELPIDEPVKFNDHAMDAMRYALANAVKKYGTKYFRTSRIGVGSRRSDSIIPRPSSEVRSKSSRPSRRRSSSLDGY